jgi:sugar lactone lactonase YvrE
MTFFIGYSVFHAYLRGWRVGLRHGVDAAVGALIFVVNSSLKLRSHSTALQRGFRRAAVGAPVIALAAVLSAGASAQTARFVGAVKKPDVSQKGASHDAAEVQLSETLADVAEGRQPKSLLPAGNFEPVELGGKSADTSLVFAFTGSGTLGEIGLFTKGKKSLEFSDAGTGTCVAGLVFKPGDVCTVDLTFVPTETGTQYCAVDLTGASGSVLAIGYAYGVGLEPKPAPRGGAAKPSKVAADSIQPVHVDETAHPETQAIDEVVTSVNLNTSTSTVSPGGTVQLTATVATTARPTTPTGSITFYSTPQSLNFKPTTIGPAVALGEGWTTDGTYFYVINTLQTYKLNNDSTWSVATDNLSPFAGLPAGLDHLGDGKLYNGYLYIGAENYDFSRYCIYQSQTLAVYNANAAGLPLVNFRDASAGGEDQSAVAVVPSQNALYVAGYCDGSKLWIYDLGTLALKGTVTLSQNIPAIQGLTYNAATDSLFMSADASQGGEDWGGEIYQVSFKGVATPVLAVPGPGELEGLDFYQGSLGYAIAGRVHFFSGGPVAIGTVPLTSAVARLTTSAIPAGNDVITAVYSGDSKYAPATSNAIIETINRFAPKVQAVPSSLSISTSQGISLTVSVAGPNGSPNPTGSVVITSGTFTGSAVLLSAAGTATASIPAWSLATGTDPLIATYTPDTVSAATYEGAAGTVSVSVTMATPAMTVTLSSASITTAQSLGVSVSVAAPAGGPMPTGTVSLSNGTYSSTAAVLSNGSATIGVRPFSLQLGMNNLNINYTPDIASVSVYNSAVRSSSVIATRVTPAIAVTPSATAITNKQAVTATIAVSSVSGYAVPSGKVTLTSGSYIQSTTLVSGIGTINIPAGSLQNGNDILSVTYTPDATSSLAFNPVSGTSSVTVGNTLSTATTIYNGSSSNQNFGTVAIGSTSAAHSFSFSVAAGTTVGSIGVLTMGAAKMDFGDTGGGSCTARTYTAATSCTVSVTFTPSAAGTRMGAVLLYSNANNSGSVLAALPVYGMGSGAQIGFASNPVTTISPVVDNIGLNVPHSIAVDGAGNVYVADSPNNRVVEMPAGGGQGIVLAPVVNGISLASPKGLAVDGAGNLFIADGNNRVLMIPSGSGAAIAIDPILNDAGLNGPSGLAVDGMGDLFVADANNNRVVEIPFGGGTAIELAPQVNGVGLSSPAGLALDSAGNLFIADYGNGRIVEVGLGSGSASAIRPTLNGVALSYPVGVAVDGAGNLYVAGSELGVIEIPAGGGSAFYPLPSSSAVASAIAADGGGDLFLTFPNSANIQEYIRSQPASMRFLTSTPVGLVDSADGSQTAQIINTGNAPLTLSVRGYPADFMAATGDKTACATSTILGVGQQCDIPIKFAPEHSGALSQSVTIYGFTNGVPIQQSIKVSGLGLADQAAVITSPVLGSTLAGSTATFTWTGAVGVTGYQVLIGTWGAGAGNIYDSYQITATSQTLPIPTSGVKLYVRLNQEMNGVWQSTDYTYMEAGTAVPAVISSPLSGSTVKGPNVTLSWAGASGPAIYTLCASIKTTGACDVYNSGGITTTAATVTVPASGVTLYVALSQLISGIWSTANYKYKME